MSYTVSEAKYILRLESEKWGLVDKGWKFTTDNSTVRHGWCAVPNCVLGLSTVSILACTEAETMDTILHEISHALHYEWCCDNNINYSERVYKISRRGRGKWVRVIPPHGAQWKRFAIRVGAKPRASTLPTANNTAVSNWRVVIVKDGRVEDTDTNCQRFLKRMKDRYVSGRKDICGHLYLVNGRDWSQTVSGQRCVNTLKFYQKRNQPTNFDNLTLSS